MARYLRKAAKTQRQKSKQAEKQDSAGNGDNAMKGKKKAINHNMNVPEEVKEYVKPWSKNKILTKRKKGRGRGGRGREQRTQKINPDGKWKVEKYPPIRVKNKQKIFKATLQNFRTVQMKIRSSKLLGSGRVHIKRTKISNKSMDPHWYLLVTSITESDILCLLKITDHPCSILPTFHLSKNTHTHRILSSL